MFKHIAILSLVYPWICDHPPGSKSGSLPEPCSALARKLGVSRARVTQVLAILRLAPEIQEYLRAMPEESDQRSVTDRTPGRIIRANDLEMQVAEFEALLQ